MGKSVDTRLVTVIKNGEVVEHEIVFTIPVPKKPARYKYCAYCDYSTKTNSTRCSLCNNVLL